MLPSNLRGSRRIKEFNVAASLLGFDLQETSRRARPTMRADIKKNTIKDRRKEKSCTHGPN